MQPFIYGDSEVRFWKHVGVVISAQVRSETHVSSSGGGGYMTEGTGYVSAPQVHSRVERQQDIWIRRPDGSQHCVRLHNRDYPVIAGQRVTFISSARADSNDGYYTIFINHDAGKWWWIVDVDDLVRDLKLAGRPIQPRSGGLGCGGWLLAVLGGLAGYFAYAFRAELDAHPRRYEPQDADLVTISGGAAAALLTIAGLLWIRRATRASRDRTLASRQSEWRRGLVAGLEKHLDGLGTHTAYPG